MLHKAFSVFVFRRNRNELLLQKRHPEKLFGNLWANTCCSHPQAGETTVESAKKRLKEECGFTCPLREIASFVYRAPDPAGNGSEFEYDTILTGDIETDVSLDPDPKEISDIVWKPLEEIVKDLARHPKKYAPWFPIALHGILVSPHA